MVLRTMRETMATLRESRDAIREGRTAIREARVELEVRYRTRQHQVERIEQAIELLQADGPETDLRRLLPMLDSDVGSGTGFDSWNGDESPPSDGVGRRQRDDRPDLDARTTPR